MLDAPVDGHFTGLAPAALVRPTPSEDAMNHLYKTTAFALLFCLTSVATQGAQRGREHGGKPPGGQWSERSHGGKQNHTQAGNRGQQGNRNQEANRRGESQGLGNSEGRGKAGGRNDAAGLGNTKGKQAFGAGDNNKAAGNRKGPQANGVPGAAGKTFNQPQSSGAKDAAAGAAVANRNQPETAGAAAAGAGYDGVRNSFTHPDMYGAAWYGAHPDVWAAGGWAAGAAWRPSTWGSVSSFVGYGTAAPISYNYGENVVAQNGNVVANGQNVGSAEEFSQQAADLAQSGADAQTSNTDEWLPLGVFAMVRNEKQHAQLIVQLAINKQGILRGNYTDEVTEHTQPIHGAADKKTQRVAWTVGGNQQTVMEAGLSDLTDGEAPALIHKNGKTDHWLLVRLDQPKQADGSDPANGQK